jgi:predicted nucleotidyltransferase component of viral defense system
MIDQNIIEEKSKEFDIDEFTILREYLQLLFLKYFYSLKGSEKVYFKGGTVLRFFLHSFRFSEDLDFTSLLDKDTTMALVKKTILEMEKETPGIKLNSIKRQKLSLSGRINYKPASLKYPLTIHLEFSFREKPQTRQTSLLETTYPITPYPLVVHPGFEEILAEKIRALAIRSKGRDIFDIWYLLTKGIKIDWTLVREKMLYYGKTFTEEDFERKIKRFKIEDLERDLRRFLPKRHRVIIKELPFKLLNEVEKWGRSGVK